MPALPNITFTKNGNGLVPVQKNGNAWMLQSLSSGGKAAFDEDTTAQDCAVNVTIPSGYVGMTIGKMSAITGAPHTAIQPVFMIGAGTPGTFKYISVDISAAGAAETITAASDVAYFVLLKPQDLLYTMTGTYA